MDNDKLTPLPEYVASFTRLAGVLDIARSHLHEISTRDSRFPGRTRKGWPVTRIGLFLRVRELEHMSDGAYDAWRHEAASAMLAKLESEGETDQRMLSMLREIASGKRDIGPDGRSARALMIEELLGDIPSA